MIAGDARVIRQLREADADSYVELRRQGLLEAPLAFGASPEDDIAASAEAVRLINQESGADAASELELDLGSLASVRAVAHEIETRDVPLRALVCNAGLQMSKGLQLSSDGFELTFQDATARPLAVADALASRARPRRTST